MSWSDVAIFVTLIAATTATLMGALYLLLRLMARREDLGEMIREAILTTDGFVIIERRKFTFTEQFFKDHAR